MGTETMKVFTLNIPTIYWEAFEVLQTHYPSKSEIMRVALRDFLVKELAFDSLLTGEDRTNIIRRVQEELINMKERHLKNRKHQPLGNGFYINGGDEEK